MKKLILLLIFLLITETCFAEKAAGLRGIVVLQNSNGQPVATAQISAFDATAQASDSSGRFELVFTANKKAGDKVVLSVQKQGLEVVNRKELDVIIPANPDEIVKIVMCKTGERDRHARMYYEIAEKSINDSYEERLKQINEKYEKDLTEKNKEIQKLKAQKTAGLSQAKDLAEKFAEVNLDDVSALYKEAFALFQKGKIDKAIQVLEDEKMDKLLKAAQEEKRKAQERLTKSEEAIRQSIETYILKARMCKTRFQFDEAEKNYRKAIEADWDSFDNIIEFAVYLGKQNKHSQAIQLYERALSLSKGENQTANTLNNLGLLYSDNNRYGDAEKAHSRALEIREKLSKQNPDAYLPDLAETLNNIGILYKYCSRYEDAETVYKRALKIREQLAKQNPDIHLRYLAAPLNNLGALYYSNKQYGEAEKVFMMALEIYERLAKQNSYNYLPDCAATLNNLGALYLKSNRYEDTEKVYNMVLKIYEKLAKQNPRVFEIQFCATLMNLSLFQADLLKKEPKQGYKIKGLSYVERAISILSKYPDVPQAQEYMKRAIKLKQKLENTPVK